MNDAIDDLVQSLPQSLAELEELTTTFHACKITLELDPNPKAVKAFVNASTSLVDAYRSKLNGITHCIPKIACEIEPSSEATKRQKLRGEVFKCKECKKSFAFKHGYVGKLSDFLTDSEAKIEANKSAEDDHFEANLSAASSEHGDSEEHLPATSSEYEDNVEHCRKRRRLDMEYDEQELGGFGNEEYGMEYDEQEPGGFGNEECASDDALEDENADYSYVDSDEETDEEETDEEETGEEEIEEEETDEEETDEEETGEEETGDQKIDEQKIDDRADYRVFEVIDEEAGLGKQCTCDKPSLVERGVKMFYLPMDQISFFDGVHELPVEEVIDKK